MSNTYIHAPLADWYCVECGAKIAYRIDHHHPSCPNNHTGDSIKVREPSLWWRIQRWWYSK
jgi:hypothetical protein